MTGTNRHLDRRAFVGAGAGALTALLAGCAESANTTEEPTGTSGSGGSALVEPQFDFVGGRPPTEVQFNPWNVANFGHTYHIYWTTPLATAYSDGTIASDYLESMTAEGKTLTLKFPTGWKYWNGRELKAEDFYIQMEINRFQDPENSPFASTQLVDEQTVTLTFKESVVPSLMKAALVGKYQITPRWIYRDYLKRYQNASGKSERDSVTQELLQMTIPTKEFAEKGLGNGLYEIQSFGPAETRATKFADHPYADRTNLQKTRIIPVGDNTDSLATNNKLDRVSYIMKRERRQYPKDLKNQYKLKWFRTQKYILNWKNPHLAKRPVRRAIISAIDLEAITAAARKYMAQPTQVQTGLRSSIHDQYLGKDFVNKLIHYPVGGDTQQAAKYMRQAGYSKKNGTWVSPDGEKVSLTILTRTNVGQAQPTKVMSDQLNTFGIQTTINAVGDSYYTKLQEWNFDIGWVWHVAKALWHPTSYFSNDFYGVLAGEPGREGPGPTGIPDTVTIPKEVGAKEVQGQGVKVKPAQLMNVLPSSSSKEEVVKRTRTLSQWFNYDLPDIVYMQENTGYAGDAAHFNFPSEDKKMNMNYPGREAWKRGWISGKTE